MSDELTILFDPKLMRPGCVILQAAYGGDRRAGTIFDSSTWLVAPTDGMRLIRGSLAQWQGLAQQVNIGTRRAVQP